MSLCTSSNSTNPAFSGKARPMATSAAAAPGLLQQVGMAGGAAVITVTFIHPIDVVKVRLRLAVVSPDV